METALTIQQNTRQMMVQNKQVMLGFTDVEKMILVATTGRPICTIGRKELAEKVAILAKGISRDVGIRSIDQYDATRFFDILVKYYKYMTIEEVKLAFELASIGELDQYLPKDRDGNADKNHYQSFSLEFIAKIISAYKKASKDLERRAKEKMPEPERVVSEKEKAFYRRESFRTTYRCYMLYKYKGALRLDGAADRVVYAILEDLGLAAPIDVTDEDRRLGALRQTRKEALDVGQIIADFTAEVLNKDKAKYQAYRIALHRAIQQSFDEIINEGYSLLKYLK